MKIDKGNYEGYIWMSDSKTPVIIDKEWECEVDDCDNPFIIEGQLYNRDTGKSISIRHIDGRYYVGEGVVAESDYHDPNVDVAEYIPHRMPGIRALRFLQYWTPEPDNLCEGLNTLVPSIRLFAGFKR